MIESKYAFPESFRAALEDARRLAEQAGERTVGPDHILLAILNDPTCPAYRILAALGANPTTLKKQLRSKEGSRSTTPRSPTYGRGAMQLVQSAMKEAAALSNDHTGTEHLLLSLVRPRPWFGRPLFGSPYWRAGQLLRAAGVLPETIENKLRTIGGAGA